MIVDSLALKNFMPYKGTQSLSFPVGNGLNVTVIYGDNMRGKTSLLNGLRWALYGKVVGRHMRILPADKILNSDAFAEGDFVVEAKLVFHTDINVYELIRTQRLKHLISSPRGPDDFVTTASLKKDGQPIPGHLVDFEVAQVLPESISRFSLFDGELLQEYEQLVSEATEQSDDIRDAIERALGVPALVNAKTHLTDLSQRCQQKLFRESVKDTRHLQYASELEAQVETAKSDRDDLKRMYDDIETERDALSEKLTTFGNAVAVRSKVEQLDAQITQLVDSYNKAVLRRSALSEKAWLALISHRLVARRTEEEAKLSDAHSEARRTFYGMALQDLRTTAARKGTCEVCGSELTATARDLLSNRTSDTAVMASVDATLSALAVLSKTVSTLNALGANATREELIYSEREIDRLRLERLKISDQKTSLLKDVPGVDFSEVRRMTERKDTLQKELGRLALQVSNAVAHVNSLQRKYDALLSSAALGERSTSRGLAGKATLLKTLATIFESSVDGLRDRLKSSVQEYATETFKALSSEKEYKGLKINDRYGLEILDHLNRRVSVRSAGAEQVVALSLIDGLAKARSSGGLLVMDTPFGRLDLKHRASVLEHLPSMATQVVLLVHEGELNRSSELGHILPYVSASYDIERVTPTQSRLVAR